jgi:hypothetical protein
VPNLKRWPGATKANRRKSQNPLLKNNLSNFFISFTTVPMIQCRVLKSNLDVAKRQIISSNTNLSARITHHLQHRYICTNRGFNGASMQARI